jgi:hypothetical protein
LNGFNVERPFAHARVLPRRALDRYLLRVESRLDTEDASRSTLAGEAVADRDSNRLSLDG